MQNKASPRQRTRVSRPEDPQSLRWKRVVEQGKSRAPLLRTLGRWVCFLACLFSLASCTVPRQGPTSSEDRVLYFPAITFQDIRGEIAKRCIACHNSTKQEGSYNLSSYAGILGAGSDPKAKANAIPGDRGSLILTTLQPKAAVKEHRVDRTWKDRLTRWVVDFRLAYFRSSIHSSDIHLPTTKGFHGTLISSAKWDLSECISCHGSDLKGGGSNVSCLQCHNVQKPEGCASCHQVTALADRVFQGPRSQHSDAKGDVHQAHFRSRWMTALTCSSCHKTPTTLRSAGHLDGKVQVVLGVKAQRNGKQPQWNREQHTCNNTYCHESGISGATTPTPSWKKPKEAISCLSCHGNPPSKLRDGRAHPNNKRCYLCHNNVDKKNKIIQPELHINGIVEFSYPKQCNTCHGDDKSAAPPKDLNGKTSTTGRGVGAHRNHLRSNGRHVAVACNACHIVPSTTGAKGHLDGDASAEVIFNYLAKRGGLKPSWDRATNTCSNVYCHGASMDGGAHTSPQWTKVNGAQFTCGSCHGSPPRKVRSGASHTASKECYLCHRSMGADGTIKKPELHINGRVDL